jgi:hypothetical protein
MPVPLIAAAAALTPMAFKAAQRVITLASPLLQQAIQQSTPTVQQTIQQAIQLIQQNGAKWFTQAVNSPSGSYAISKACEVCAKKSIDYVKDAFIELDKHSRKN